MSHLVLPKIECVETKDNFGRFVLEPLDKGLGVTLGNVMRRVLLGQLQGAAVTRVKIEGIQHEFTTIPHVKEDVIELLLNIKSLRLKPLSDHSGKLVLEVDGENDVTAADIKPSADFEITNPELHLATLDSADSKLYLEMDVELSKGYREAESGGNMSVGVIPIDAVFSPVRKVNYTIAPMSTGEQVGYETLCLELWTDGTISPVDAVNRAAELVLEQVAAFVNSNRVAKVSEEPGQQTVSTEIYNMPVEQLNLSVRTLNCLRRGGITTLGEVISRGEKELMSLRNFGQKSKVELEERLAEMGLSLASQDEGETGDSEETDMTAEKVV
ncbi:MAG: DNA-directed RNA polymerase subunit alpha [Dehalococcoidales bacterium]|nr:DNA-directed RNA polymerase subunit alpha [Dehalococcoidales bacterium]